MGLEMGLHSWENGRVGKQTDRRIMNILRRPIRFVTVDATSVKDVAIHQCDTFKNIC